MKRNAIVVVAALVGAAALLCSGGNRRATAVDFAAPTNADGRFALYKVDNRMLILDTTSGVARMERASGELQFETVDARPAPDSGRLVGSYAIVTGTDQMDAGTGLATGRRGYAAYLFDSSSGHVWGLVTGAEGRAMFEGERGSPDSTGGSDRQFRL